MWKKIGLAVFTVAVLAACEVKTETVHLPVCTDPAVARTIQDSLRQLVNEQVRQFTASDVRDFVDSDKVAAVLDELSVQVDEAMNLTQADAGKCGARLTLTLPSASWARARENAPLLYGEASLTKMVEQRLAGSLWQFSDQGVLSNQLRYVPHKDADGSLTLVYDDASLAVAANALTTALLPYGVKEQVVIDGQVLSLTDALARVQNGEGMEVVEEIPEEDRLGEFLAEQKPGSETPVTEVLQPDQEAQQMMAVSDAELARAKAEYQEASEAVNRRWDNMEQTVQQALAQEQQAWLDTQDEHCRQAAAQAVSSSHAEYLYAQCGARMMCERIQYLKGYSIN